MPELSLWRVRRATAREKKDAGLPPRTDVDAVLDRPNHLLAVVTRTGVVLWMADTVWDQAELELLLTARSLWPLTADPDLSKLPPAPKRRRESPDIQVRRLRLRMPRFNIPGM